MAAIGRKGGDIGGKRLKTMTKAQGSRVATKGATARWKKAVYIHCPAASGARKGDSRREVRDRPGSEDGHHFQTRSARRDNQHPIPIPTARSRPADDKTVQLQNDVADLDIDALSGTRQIVRQGPRARAGDNDAAHRHHVRRCEHACWQNEYQKQADPSEDRQKFRFQRMLRSEFDFQARINQSFSLYSKPELTRQTLTESHVELVCPM